MLELDKEEMHIDLMINLNDTNCTDLGFNEKVDTIRFMLWDELFDNNMIITYAIDILKTKQTENGYITLQLSG
jgi:hypothetical protein